MNAPLSPALQETLRNATIDDKYTVQRGRAWMSGLHALVRLPMLQQQRDHLAGLNTAGYVSGYRGSPLGTFDIHLAHARKHLDAHNITFQPGLNEELAATAVWGTQQLALYPKGRYDGVFGMWYGKGPGVDRCGDVFKHANAAGTSPHGGVLVLAGDDHPAKSSTLPHQSEHMFKAAMIPVLFPASVQEYIDYGLHGWAMSRYAGVWVAMKCITDIVEASASVDIDPDRVQPVTPADFQLPEGGLNIRWPDTPLQQEARLLDFKLYAALAYARANRLNRVVLDAPNARFGIVASGKAYLDVRQALDDLGLDEQACRTIGLRLYKVGMVWPLEAQGVRQFADGLEEILVVEEKRQIIEYQIKEELFGWVGTGKKIPRVIGKFDEKDGGEWAVPQGNWILPAHYEFTPAIVAKAIASRLTRLQLPDDVRAAIDARLTVIHATETALARPHVQIDRKPWFCSGCPHNTSTRVPEGSRAVAGIGCHYMVTWMDRQTSTFTQMGGEGVPWLGQAPFTDEKHIFVNLGDGTYLHSGSLAIRAAVVAKVSMTFKILYNDAVAMTGGQRLDGTLTVADITHQMAAEGVRRIAVVTDEPEKYKGMARFAEGTSVHHRKDLDDVQRDLRQHQGVSVLIYDQTCAAEKRRRRKRNAYPDPPKRVFINHRVCEGCGDCSDKSNCLSVEPIDTPYGRKRAINQSSCNKDYSCLDGFCPSFVTVEGGQLRQRSAVEPVARMPAPGTDDDVPVPPPVALDRPYGIVIAGIGGTGVVTMGQIIGMAAHLEAKGASVLDMAGLAQKGGAVHSHVVLAPAQNRIHSTRVAMGEADLVLGTDVVVTAGAETRARMQPGRTHVLLNGDAAPTAAFIHDPDWRLPQADLQRDIAQACGGPDAVINLNAAQLALALSGDAIYANALMLGYAFQVGWLPVTRASLRRAFELNGVDVEPNLNAFEWGRKLAHKPALAERILVPAKVIELHRPNKEQRLASSDVMAAPTTPLHEYSEQPLALEPGEHQRGKRASDRHEPDTNAGIGAPDGSRAPIALRDAALTRLVQDRMQELTAYQSAAYAQRYAKLIEDVARHEDVATGGSRFTATVARNAFKLMAYKDEYEVARLYTDAEFMTQLSEQFEGNYKLRFHLAPPLLSRRDRHGHLIKQTYGPWMLSAFKLLARLKFLRGSWLDPFGHTAERRAERELIADYVATVQQLAARLTPANLDTCIAIAALPETIRGYGHIKEANRLQAQTKQRELFQRLDTLSGRAVGDGLVASARWAGEK